MKLLMLALIITLEAIRVGSVKRAAISVGNTSQSQKATLLNMPAAP
jgi:hypothetical protein